MNQDHPLESELAEALDQIRTLTAQNRKLREQKRLLVAELEQLKANTNQ